MLIEATECGHKIDAKDAVILATKVSKFNNKCRGVRYGSYCKVCAQEQIQSGNVVTGDDEVFAWLNNDNPRIS